jgi:hypothetical protein
MQVAAFAGRSLGARRATDGMRMWPGSGRAKRRGSTGRKRADRRTTAPASRQVHRRAAPRSTSADDGNDVPSDKRRNNFDPGRDAGSGSTEEPPRRERPDGRDDAARGAENRSRKEVAMKKYHSKSNSAARLEYGHELDAGLKAFPETAPLAAEFAPANERLAAAYQERLARSTGVVRTRAVLRIAEFQSEREIRGFARVLEASEGGRRGPAFDVVLPEGVTPVIVPRRAAQARAIRRLIERLVACTLPAATSVAGEWVPRLTATVERLEAAVADHEHAVEAHDEAFRRELMCRDDHERAVDRTIGRVRAAFPLDHAQQDAVFPAADSHATRKDDDAVADDTTAEPPAAGDESTAPPSG